MANSFRLLCLIQLEDILVLYLWEMKLYSTFSVESFLSSGRHQLHYIRGGDLISFLLISAGITIFDCTKLCLSTLCFFMVK